MRCQVYLNSKNKETLDKIGLLLAGAQVQDRNGRITVHLHLANGTCAKLLREETEDITKKSVDTAYLK